MEKMQPALIILVVIIGGLFVGRFLRGREKTLKRIDRVLECVLWALLFFLGVWFGTNKEILNNVGKIGYKAAVLAGAAVLGSALLTGLLYTIWFRKPGHEK